MSGMGCSSSQCLVVVEFHTLGGVAEGLKLIHGGGHYPGPYQSRSSACMSKRDLSFCSLSGAWMRLSPRW